VAAVAVGGVAGAEARYGLAVALPHDPGSWPWATLLANASGCLLIGVLMVLVTERFAVHPLVRPLLGIGVLGGTQRSRPMPSTPSRPSGRAVPGSPCYTSR
jgi:CrcB protein